MDLVVSMIITLLTGQVFSRSSRTHLLRGMSLQKMKTTHLKKTSEIIRNTTKKTWKCPRIWRFRRVNLLTFRQTICSSNWKRRENLRENDRMIKTFQVWKKIFIINKLGRVVIRQLIIKVITFTIFKTIITETKNKRNALVRMIRIKCLALHAKLKRLALDLLNIQLRFLTIPCLWLLLCPHIQC